jgi:AmmeMemoRadiSam system protein A
MSGEEKLKGDMGRFGREEVSLSFDSNTELVRKIIEYAKLEGINSGGIDKGTAKKYGISGELDHGALVPLYYINKEYKDFKLVHISVSTLPAEELYKFGMCIAKAVEDLGEKAVFVASGDLSHRLTQDAPYGYTPRGKEFDDFLINSFLGNDIESLLDVDENLCEEAGECGLRAFIMMFGAMDGLNITPQIYSYEGPFGVGYSVARFQIGEENSDRKVLEKKIKSARNQEDQYVALARKALETYVKDKAVLDAPVSLPQEMLNHRAGTFVSIKKNGQLRGCIGTIEPTRENIAEEIINNAISSGIQDPRFNPVKLGELDSLVYSVDVLMEPEPIDSLEDLDVIKYGVIVKSGYRSGLLLPNLEGVDSPEEQVSIALQKAGIGLSEDYIMERFEVIRHK